MRQAKPYNILIVNILILLSGTFMFAFPSYQETPRPFTQIGEASYYARRFEGRKTASGSIYYNERLTAAHKTLPFGTMVSVTNLKNNRSVIVEINDRGPYARRRIIDLSLKAARQLEMLKRGTAKVKVEVVEPAPGYAISDSISK